MHEIKSGGDPFGSHRVISPKGVLPQPAERVDNDLSSLWDNEVLVDVDWLNIDSASFTQLKSEQGGNETAIRERIIEIVASRGKMHNPVTGSGGMLIGKVSQLGPKYPNPHNLQVGDEVVSLVSLSLTPLRIDDILRVNMATDQVQVRGQAVFFASGLLARLPADLPKVLSLAILDVCGAPAQTARLTKAGDRVVVVGAGGKSGLLCCYEAKKRVGASGQVIGLEYSEAGIAHLRKLGLCDQILRLDARDALACHRAVSEATDGDLAQVVINCVNLPDTELSSVMMCRQRGTVYFFSMATSFTKAALGAEGIGRDVDMLIGNGYAEGHADHALGILRQSTKMRAFYQENYL